MTIHGAIQMRCEDVDVDDKVRYDGEWLPVVDFRYLSGDRVQLDLDLGGEIKRVEAPGRRMLLVRRTVEQSATVAPMTDYNDTIKLAHSVKVGDLVVIRDIAKPVFAMTVTDDEENEDFVFVCFEDETYVKVPGSTPLTVRVPDPVIVTLELTKSKALALRIAIDAFLGSTRRSVAEKEPLQMIRRELRIAASKAGR